MPASLLLPNLLLEVLEVLQPTLAPPPPPRPPPHPAQEVEQVEQEEQEELLRFRWPWGLPCPFPWVPLLARLWEWAT